MGLVDYTSDSSDSAEQPPPAKKQKKAEPSSPTTAAGALPPLPAAFHDLYASTVRTSTVDDPALHQGRRRQTPHVAGNWPSHIYIEWHPSSADHDVLRALVAALGYDLQLDQQRRLSSFLTSDLGAPLPLHVSLSRPFVLRTEEKDDFLDELVASLQGCNLPPFDLCADHLSWHRSPDSNRSFLVLRVLGSTQGHERSTGRNTELTTLLDRCNSLVSSYKQPTLYQSSPEADNDSFRTAFHVSVAWSFAEPTDDIQERTAAVFAREEFRTGISRIRIPVDSVKAKIGNTVTNIVLLERGRKGVVGHGGRSLFRIKGR